MSRFDHSYEQRFNVTVKGASVYTDDIEQVLGWIYDGDVDGVEEGHADVIAHDGCTEYVRRTHRFMTNGEFIEEFDKRMAKGATT